MKTLLPLFFLFCLTTCAWVKKETYMRYTQEETDGQVFAHRVKVADGVVEQVWNINGKQVSQDEYQDRYLAARNAELKAERKAQEALQLAQEEELARQQQFTRQARIMVHKRSLQDQLGVVEQLLSKVKNPRLEPYYVFGEQGFVSRELFGQVAHELVAQVHAALARSEDDLTETELVTLLSQLEQQPSRLREFYRTSVKHAINTCDDTKLLKEFLELLA
jgi:hypothetical protein